MSAEALQVWPYPKLSDDVVEKYRPAKGRKPDSGWTMEDCHPAFIPGGACYTLFDLLCTAIEDARPDWERYVTKYYVGFRTGGKKLHVSIQELTSTGALALGLPKTVDVLNDPEGIAQDKREQSGFGPGCPTRVDLTSAADLDRVMALVLQC